MTPKSYASFLAFTFAAISSLVFAKSSAQSPAPQLPTLRLSSRIVVVDVVVTDSSGRPVHGLKQSDFTLIEGKAPQTIASFEEYSAADAPKPSAIPKLPPGTFTNFTPAPAGSAVNVLLLDALNTPISDQIVVRDQLLQYLKSAPTGTEIAIFGLGNRLSMLQAFTSDPETLKNAVQRKKASQSALLDPSAISTPESLNSQTGDAAINANLAYNVATFETEMQSSQLQIRIQETLDALNQLARYLADIPGRKNLIWFSGSFPIDVVPDPESSGSAFAGMFSMEDEFRETSALLGRSQVAVYPIDARGLMVSPNMSAQSSGSNLARAGAFGTAQRNFSTNTFRQQGTMEELARNTGGKAFVNTNGLAQAVAGAISAGANYYTLSYIPSEPTPAPGAFRSIHLQLTRDNGHAKDTLTYRHGYFAEKDPGTQNPQARHSQGPTLHLNSPLIRPPTPSAQPCSTALQPPPRSSTKWP